MLGAPRRAADSPAADTELRLLRTLARLSGIGAWECDVGGERMLWTEEVYRIVGLAPGSVSPSLGTLLSLIEPTAQQRLRSAIDRAFDCGQGWDLELPARAPNQRVRWLRIVGAAHAQHDGGRVLCGTLEDWTARRTPPEAPRADARHAPPPWAAAASQPSVMADAADAGSRPPRRIERRSGAAGDAPRGADSAARHLRADEDRAWLLGSDSGGTEPRDDESRLRDALQRVELATERAGVGVFMRDSGTGGGYWSPQVFRLFDMPQQAQAPSIERVMQRLHPDDRLRYLQLRGASMTGAATEDLRVRVLLPGGQLRWLLIHGRREQPGGGPVNRVAGVVLDVTAEEQAKAQAAATAAWLQLSTEASGIGTWERDLATGAGRWDATMYALCGLPPLATVPSLDAVMHSVHPADRERAHQAWRRMAETNEVVEFEHRVVRLDGQVRHFLSRGRCERRADGTPVRLFGTTLDVTESRKTSNQLAITLRRLQLATEAGGIGTWERDLVNGAGQWDAMMRQLMGLLPDEPVPTRARLLSGFMHPDDREPASAAWRLMAESTHAIEFEYRMTRPDGSVVHISARGLVERDEDGRPLRAVGTATDITPTRVAQQRLRELSEWMQLASGATGVAFFRLGLDDETQYTDAQMKKLYGFDPNGPDPTVEQFYAAILPEDLDRVRQARERSQRSDQTIEAEYRVRGPDGVLRQILTRRALLRDEQGQPLYVVGTAIDVTASRSVQAALQTANQRLALAQRTAGIGIWEWDVASGAMKIDAAIRALLGVGDEWTPDFEGWLARVHPDDRAKARAVYDHALPAHISEGRSEYRILRADGTLRYVDERYAIHRDAAGRAVHLLGTNLDITDIREAEHERAALVNRLQLATQTAGMGVWERNLATGVEQWDAQMHAIYGTAPSIRPTRELWLAHVHPQDRPTLQARLPEFDAGGGMLEYRIIRADGQVRHIADRSMFERPAGGPVARVLGVHLDVTDIRRAERERDELARRMQMAAHSIGMGVWEWQPQTGQSAWSEQMFALVGQSGSKQQRDWLQVVHPDEREQVRRSVVAILKAGESAQLEFRVLWADGSEHWLATRARIQRDSAGRAAHLVGVAWDITERKCAEAALLAKEAAERASRAKTEFLSRVSHELRTPLNAILGFTQILELDPAQPLSAVQRERVEHIKQAGWHLLELINEILDLSRIEAGAATFSMAAVAAHEVAAECLALVHAEAARRRLSVDLVETPGQSPCVLWADRTRLKQVLLNLLSNAVKYNSEGGAVVLSIDSDERGWGRIAVRDSGLGLSPAQRDKLFQPFNRLGMEAAPIEGTGIGLTIAKKLVEQMGGSIRVQSQPRRGSEFTVTLPLAGAASQPTAAPPALDGSTLERTDVAGSVLYVEDHAANRALLEAVLRLRPKVMLLKAADGAAARVLAAMCHPDLILLDMRLPDTDGLSLFRALRAQPQTRDIPCIGLSANALPSDIEAARAAGFLDYLTKPLIAAELLRCLDRVLARRA